jgi:hypothetical protein
MLHRPSRAAILTLLFLATPMMVSCTPPIKDNPIDEMTNWTRATIAFATAVESITAAGKAGEITKEQGRLFRPLVLEGQDLLNKAYRTIAATPKNEDPVFDADLTHRLMRIAITIGAQLAVEKARNAEPSGGQ